MKIPKFINHCNLFFLVSILVLAPSCLRYVPSQKEIASSSGVDLGFFGEQEFYSNSIEQEKRLKSLLEDRAKDSISSEGQTYKIGAGDVLDINVFNVEDLNRKVRVSPTGTITLPLLNTFSVERMTENEVKEEVEKRLKKFVRFPQVQVYITEYDAHKVNIIGQVFRPGAYALRRNSFSLTELLSEAGGRTQNAAGIIILIPKEIQTQKLEESQLETISSLQVVQNYGIEIYLDDILGTGGRPPLFIPLRFGDTVVVPEAGKIQVSGEVEAPGSYPLSARLNVLGAIASAKGLTYSADVSSVEIIRDLGDGKKALITVNLEQLLLPTAREIRLRDGDVVRVPSSSGRFATRQVISTINSFFRIGVSGSITP